MLGVVQKGRLVNIPGQGAATAVAMGFGGQMELRLPNFHMLRLVARSLLALALVSLYLLHSGSKQDPGAAAATKAAAGMAPSPQTGDGFLLSLLFHDLKRQGVLPSGGRAMFLGQAAGGSILYVLRQNRLDLVTGCECGGECRAVIPDRSLDFVFSDARFFDAKFVDRVLKIGGVAAVRLSLNQAGDFWMGPNYKIVYVRNLGLTVVAMKKPVDQYQSATEVCRRRLLAVLDGTRKEALKRLEDVLLEPPAGRMARERYLKRTKYLPDLTGVTLNEYPRRVFVDVSSNEAQRKPIAGTDSEIGTAARWFERNYPTKDSDFEVIRVEVMTEKVAAGERDEEGMSGWLKRNVREEEYVVMKADAGVVEGMVRSGAMGLVDELFLGCGAAGPRRLAYWECLSLYGELRDAGVAVHQWWWD